MSDDDDDAKVDEGTVKRRRTTEHAAAVKLLTNQLKELIEVLNRELDNCRDDSDDHRDLVQSKVRQLGRGIGLYARCFQELAVKDRQEMDQLLKNHFTDKEIREAVDDLLACEDGWNNLLERMEKIISKHGAKHKAVTEVPLDVVIYEGDQECNIRLVGQGTKRLLLILLRHLA